MRVIKNTATNRYLRFFRKPIYGENNSVVGFDFIENWVTNIHKADTFTTDIPATICCLLREQPENFKAIKVEEVRLITPAGEKVQIPFSPRRVLVTTHEEAFEAWFIQFCPYAAEGEAGLLCYYEKDDGQVDSQLPERVKFITPKTGETI